MSRPSPRLLEEAAAEDPLLQLERWFEEATQAGEAQPDAMALATASAAGLPSVRMVLLKRFDGGGLVFYTDYDSDKGRDLEVNPHAAGVIFWALLHRQVRASGPVSALPRRDSEAYFSSRPHGAQVSAAASRQSRPVTRQVLEAEVARIAAAHPASVPPPARWGGYVMRPERFEFWQGRPDRLHDRLRYDRRGSTWAITRLSP